MRLIITAIIAATLSACATINAETVAEMSDYDVCRYSGPGWITTSSEQSVLNDAIKTRGLDCSVQHARDAQRNAQMLAALNQFNGYPAYAPSGDFQSTNANACLTYTSTGRRYQVEADVVSGSYLNQQTNTMNYNALRRYVVVFWGPGQATLIEMTNLYSDSLPTFAQSGTDQQGNEWRVQQLTAFC